jgi:hypothetical protein
LSEEQRSELDGLVDEMWQAERASRVEEHLAWFEQQVPLTADVQAGVREILAQHESARSDCFRSYCEQDDWPDREVIEAQMEELQTQRQKQLEEILPTDVVERFLEERHRRRHFGSKRGERGGKHRSERNEAGTVASERKSEDP